MTETLTDIVLGLLGCSLGYVLFALGRVLQFRGKIRNPPLADGTRAVTVVKPVCGLEVELAENLRSFCDQDYGDYQVIFGVRASNDPAIPVIREVMAEFPDRDLALVIDDRIIGSNYKISNIANMAAAAKHDVLVISDSDMRVGRDYLRAVVAPFACEGVGASTCLYSGESRGGMASTLAAMFVNDWFLPSALIPHGLAEQRYCFGATMAVRRDVLDEAGGFAALADYLADDYMLGKVVSDAGYRIALVPYIVTNVMHEDSLQSAYQHELRWARTIRSVQPAGYAASAITETLPIALAASAALLWAGHSLVLSTVPLAAALALRLALHAAVSGMLLGGRSFAPWLVPVRDLLSLTVRISAYFGSRVLWRDNAFTVMDDNRIRADDDDDVAPRPVSSQRA